MIKLFPNYQEIELTEDKKDKDKNYEWYKGVVFDPDTKEFKVISGQFTDKKDFYEKLTKKGYIVRKAYEKTIWDWIQKNAKNTLDGYLMCSTAVSKWKNTNLLDDYYIKLMNDFPQFNRERVKGNPNTKGKKESMFKEDENFDIDLMRPEDDIEGRDVANLKIFGIENITYNTNEGNIYANILKKSKYVKDYIESLKTPKDEVYCYIWKHNFSKNDLSLNLQKQKLYGKFESLVKAGDINIEKNLFDFVNKKELNLLTPDFIKYVANSSLDTIKKEADVLKTSTNINKLSLTGTDHEYISWEDIENNRGSATDADTKDNFISLGIHLKDWDKYLKNTPVDTETPLQVNKDMPFICLEKLQEINTSTTFIKYGLLKEGYDYIEGVSSNIIELRYAQSFQFSSKAKTPSGLNLDADKDLTAVYRRIASGSKDSDLDQKSKELSNEYLNLVKSGAYKWKNDPNFMQNIEKIYGINKVHDTLKNQQADIINKNVDTITQNIPSRVGDINTGKVMVKPASRIHGGDSDATFINKLDSHIQDQTKAKANELYKKQEIEKIEDTIKDIRDKIRDAKSKDRNTEPLLHALDQAKKELKRQQSEFKVFNTNSTDIPLSSKEEEKVNKLLSAIRTNRPVGIRTARNYDPKKLFNNFIKNYKKQEESYGKDFKQMFEAILSLPTNYNATQMYVNEPSIKQNNCAVVPLMGTIREDSLDKISMENHDTVNPKLFDVYNDSLLEDVQIAMMKIAKDFYDKLEFTPELSDIYFTGSNANYNYTDDSDVDIHLVFDFEKVGINAELLTEYFKLKKKIYNTEHNIKIKGYPVEVGVENINTPLVTSGIYSLKQNKWIKKPSKETFASNGANLGDYEQAVHYIENAINTKDPKQMLRLWKEITKNRRESLANYGETAPYNIIFKKLRAEGYLQRLRDAYYNYASKDLSLEALEEIQ